MGAISLMGEGSRENAAAGESEYRHVFQGLATRTSRKTRKGYRRKKVKETLLWDLGNTGSPVLLKRLSFSDRMNAPKAPLSQFCHGHSCPGTPLCNPPKPTST